MNTIKLPFALSVDNTILHISNAALPGMKTNYTCPGCKAPVIAIKGKYNQHHFRHKNSEECRSGLESAVHLAAKKMIMTKKQITLPTYICVGSTGVSTGSIEYTAEKFSDCMVIDFDSVAEEVALPGMRADILAKKGSSLLIIEVYYRHQTENAKIERLKKDKISAIEIDLSNLTAEDVKNTEAFWSYMNATQNIRWLHNAKAQESLYPKLYKQFRLKMQERDNRVAAFKKKEKLLIVNSVKQVQKLRAEPRKKIYFFHRIWQEHIQELPWSFDQLPDFLDLKCIDSDWIFCCDRRIWQAIIYNSFVINNFRKSKFSILDILMHFSGVCKIKTPGWISSLEDGLKEFPQMIPPDLANNMPSQEITLRTYLDYLCELKIIRSTEKPEHYPRYAYSAETDFWYEASRNQSLEKSQLIYKKIYWCNWGSRRELNEA